MIRLTLGEIADIVGGTVAGADPATVVTGSVEFDSRKVTPGGLFVAFDGEHVDGHDFVAAALDKGAVAAIVTRTVDAPHIRVTDPLAAMAALAAESTKRLPVTVIGVTGSSGKTSTKDLIAHLLERLGPTIAPPGSFNNELGHPYTALRATEDTKFLVLEKGARGIGHISYLTGIARPRIGVVLNVGSAHVGEFGSREAIATAKGELVESLPEDGLAVLNADDPAVLAMAVRTRAVVRTFGEAADAHIRATDVELDALGRASFTVHEAGQDVRVTLPLSGAHHVSNALAAIAVATECGMHLQDAAGALADVTIRSRWRMEVTERADGVVVVNDAYNANPESMRAALKALAAMGRARPGARTWAVLGQMAELGDATAEEHDALGRLAVRLDISRVVAVGDVARPTAQGAALEGSWDGESAWVVDADEAIALLRAELRPGDVVLVKASRAASLERVATALVEDQAGRPEEGQ